MTATHTTVRDVGCSRVMLVAHTQCWPHACDVGCPPTMTRQGSYFDRSKLKKTSPVVKNDLNRVLMVKMVKIGKNWSKFKFTNKTGEKP